jgi:hypothetical protein
MIDRRNLLDLIGKNRGKYHSCILTCYSLDFSFFEERVLPVLRTANIKNVNVFADGKFLETAQENTTGREFKFNKSYNFQPIYTTGVFHPKIMLLTGVKHGLLIIGSGNITSSGLNTNDEIWGAFQLDNLNNDNAPLFSSVWEYLQQFTKQTYGFIPQKMQWISKYSPWLLELPSGKKLFDLESLKQSIQFVYNSKESSIFNQIKETIPKQNLSTITVISPYYDVKGEFINELHSHYTPQKFNCVLDVDYGELPTGISDTLNNVVSFYDWKICKKDFDTKFNRLHAKIFHFQYEDGNEIMVLGSANATKAAMGINGITAVNHEAGVIIKRTSKINWLTELGIKLPEETINAVKELKPNLATLYPKEPSKKYAVKILYSELRANEITIYLKESTIDKSLQVVCLSRISEITEQIECLIDCNSIKVLCAKPDELFKIYLINNEGLQISNFNIIHRLDSLIKSNPDPQQEKLDYLFEQDYPDGEGITELLQYADFSWADEESNKKINKSSSGISHSKITDTSKLYEKLNAKDFNTINNDVFLKQAGELSNSSVKIVDFLRIVSSDGSFTTANDFKESAEQSLLEDTEQKGQGENIEHSIKAKIAAEKEQRAIINYFKKLHDQYKDKLKIFYELKTLKDTPKEEITIKTLSNVLIGLQLIQLFQGKKYTVEQLNELGQEKTLVEKTYLKEGILNSEYDSIKGFLFEVFGKFLLLSTGSMKTYDYGILIQKLNYNRKETFVKSLFIMMNLNWQEREIEYRDSLILNSLYYINPTDPTNLDFLKNLQESIFKLKSEAKFVSHSFTSNWDYFCDSIFPKYRFWYRSFNDAESKRTLIFDVENLNSNSVIFSRYIGFSNVHKVNNTSNGNYSLDLKREGFEWNDDMKKHIATSIDFPLKCIKY